MKFPRNARLLRSQLDVAPFAAVFFLLVIFVMLGSLIYTPGARVELQLPRAIGLPGMDKPPVSVAIDADGRLCNLFQPQPAFGAALYQCLHALSSSLATLYRNQRGRASTSDSRAAFSCALMLTTSVKAPENAPGCSCGRLVDTDVVSFATAQVEPP